MPDRPAFLLLCLTALALILAAAQPTLAQVQPGQPKYSVMDLDVAGDSASEAWGINDMGQVVGRRNFTDGWHATYWDRTGKATDLGAQLGLSNSILNSINSHGVAVGMGSNSAIIWDPINGYFNLSALGSIPWAFTVNDNGQVVGVMMSSGQRHAFLWDKANGLLDLGVLLGRVASQAEAINNLGQVVGYSTDSNGNDEGFIWDKAHGMQALAPPSGYAVFYPNYINNVGQIAGYARPAGGLIFHAFIYDLSTQGWTDLGTLGGQNSNVNAVNNIGQAVGHSLAADGSDHAFLWHNGQMYDLNSVLDSSGAGWTLTNANSITDKGWIVGQGIFNNGTGSASHAFVLKPANVAQVATDHLQFQTAGQSIWGPGVGAFNYNLYLPGLKPDSSGFINWNTGIQSIGGFFDANIDCGFFSIDLGNFGAQARFGASGDMGIKFNAYANLGTVNVNFPYTVKLQFPDKFSLTAGTPFPVTSSLIVDSSAALTTTPPSAGASLEADFAATNTLTLEAQAFGNELLPGPGGVFSLLPSPLENINITYPIFDTKTMLNGSSATNFDLGGLGILTGSVKIPQLSAAGGLNLSAPTVGTLNAQNADTFLSLQGSLTNLITSLCDFPLGFDADLDLGVGNFDVGAGVMQFDYGASAGINQSFQFVPQPHVTLNVSVDGTSTPVAWTDAQGNAHNSSTIDFNVGDTISITMPNSADPHLTFTPTFTLPNTFSNSTNLFVDHGFDFVPIEVKGSGNAFGWSLGSFDAKIGEVNFAQTTNTFNLFNSSFALEGFPSTTMSPITIVGNQHPGPSLTEVVAKLTNPDGSTSMVSGQAPMYIINDNLHNSVAPDPAYIAFTQAVGTDSSPVTTPIYLFGDDFTNTPQTPGNPMSVYFDIHGNHYQLPATVINTGTLQVQLPSKFLLVPGIGRFTVSNSFGASNSMDFDIVYPTPKLAKAGPSLWASDPQFLDSTLSIVGSNYFDIPDYYWVDDGSHPLRLVQKFWNANFPASGPMPQFFPDFAPLQVDANNNPVAAAPLPTVYWNDQPLVPYVEPGSSGLTPSVLPNSYFATSRVATVYIQNPGPGGGRSNPVTVLIGAPTPVVSNLVPNTVKPGDPAFRLVVKGVSHIPTNPNDLTQTAYGFEANSVVYWNGQPRTTHFISATEIQADIPASDIAIGAVNQIIVGNPKVDSAGKTSVIFSAPLSFAVNNPVPVIDKTHPASAVSNDPGFQLKSGLAYNLTIRGSNFVPNSQVEWNGQPVTTTFVSSTVLEAVVPPADVALPAANTITVVNPAPGGGTSNAVTFNVTNAAPALASLSPSSCLVGGPGFTLKITGPKKGNSGGFYAGSQVYWNNTQLANPTILSAGGISVNVPASLLKTPGSVNITVVNPGPGGGTSNALPFTIKPPTLTGLILTPSSAIGGNTVYGKVTLSTAAAGNTVVSLTNTNPDATVPASVTVPAGSSSAIFTITTTAVSTTVSGKVTASLNGAKKSVTLTVNP